MASRSDKSTTVGTALATRNSNADLPGVKGPRITNVVCNMNLNCRFDLNHIAMHARNVEYRPKRFKAAVIRIREPKATALVFENGKMNVTGARSIEDAKLASRKFARMLKKLGFEPKLEDWKVNNIVGSADTQMSIRLEGIQAEHIGYARYEAEIFPGLCYTMMNPKITLLVFVKGKVVLLGAKKPEELDEAMHKIYPVLRKYRVAN